MHVIETVVMQTPVGAAVGARGAFVLICTGGGVTGENVGGGVGGTTGAFVFTCTGGGVGGTTGLFVFGVVGAG